MEYFVLGDEDTVLGFRYAGVKGRAVRTAEEARAALADLVSAGRVGVILVTDEIANAIAEDFSRMLLRSRLPVVVQMPGPGGPAANRPDLPRLIRDAMGIQF